MAPSADSRCARHPRLPSDPGGSMTSENPLPNCLLVDDLEENLLALEALLGDQGVSILKARSGEEALELLLQHDVALALLDVQMPGMDGFELAEFMRASERARDVPIIFLTAGSADQQRRFRGYEAGAVDFLQKPIEADILRSKARIFFDLYRQRQKIGAQRDALEELTGVLQTADRRKNEFLAVLAHELRNPIMAMGAGLHLMERRPDPETATMVRGQMSKYVRHLGSLVEDLLDIARIDQGKIALKKEHLLLQDLLTFAVEGSRHHIDAASHELIQDVAPEPIWLEADHARLAQVVGNLLTNAAKYTPAGGEIRLSARREEDQVRIEVADTGVGIPAEMQARIFDLFAQIDGSNQRTQEGLGIGLALVKQLVELHGGTIMLKCSAPGEGSVFEVSLPL
ncbi:sensor histidine kinase [Novosphingobium sp. YAF33]|uniref:sensor histidine kinase n=1 Tax=Novosphingobium sp. YAF33 TaxID=3233082 RepID=UPI003F95A751